MRSTPAVLNPREIIEYGFVTGHDPDLVQSNSLDLRVNRVYSVEGGVTLRKDGSRKLPPYTLVPTFQGPQGEEFYRFLPGLLYQVEFEESVDLPLWICGLTVLRSSMFKSGASGEPGLFDSGYSGGTGMSVSVKWESFVEKGAAIAQMLFFRADGAHPYKGYYTDPDWRQVKESD